jgi:hypothetical protein
MSHNDTPSNTQVSDEIVLRGGIRVERDLYAAIKHQVEFVLPDLLPDTNYTARQICGFPFWGYFSWDERQLAGRCLAHLVASHDIRLAFAQAKPAYPLRYRRK